MLQLTCCLGYFSQPLSWTGGRVVEGARLESVYTGNRIVGSNPTPSAITLSQKTKAKHGVVNLHAHSKFIPTERVLT